MSMYLCFMYALNCLLLFFIYENTIANLACPLFLFPDQQSSIPDIRFWLSFKLYLKLDIDLREMQVSASRGEEENGQPSWAPLRDTFMLTNSKLKDWDKMAVVSLDFLPAGCYLFSDTGFRCEFIA